MTIPIEKVIDIRELDIGNYLLYEGKIVSVTVLSVNPKDFSKGVIAFNEIGKTDSQIGGNIDGFGNKLDRINLTPRGLESMGFVKLDAENDIVVWGLDDSSNGEEFSIVSDGIDSPMPLFFSYDLGYQEVKKEIKYVHQLQNLYYLLMGEELKINIIQP